jgi:type I restriction enzyme M protein
MLSIAQNKIRALNSRTTVVPFGQELNPETYATCKSDMILKNNTNSKIVFGNSFSEDGFREQKFDYILSNPPFGVE